MKAIIANGVEAASQDMAWKAFDRYSKDYEAMQTEDKVKFYKTPDAILKKQLEIYDEVVKKKSAENPLFAEVIKSQIAYAQRVTRWWSVSSFTPLRRLAPLLHSLENARRSAGDTH